MAVMRGAAISILLATVLSAGCAAVLVRAGDDYQPQSAYIYGRFLLDTEDNQAMAFSIRCRDGKRYKIVFSKQENEALRMIRLPAGVCQLDDVVYKGVSSQRQMSSFRLLANEHLQPGGVYYVGDFGASASSTESGLKVDFEHGLHTVVDQRWRLLNPRNNYAATTAEMKRAYAGFASVATEDRMPRQ